MLELQHISGIPQFDQLLYPFAYLCFGPPTKIICTMIFICTGVSMIFNENMSQDAHRLVSRAMMISLLIAGGNWVLSFMTGG